MPDLIGTTLAGHLLIQEKINKGGTGVVYRALDQKSNKEVAVKVLQDDFAQDPRIRQLFIAEAKLVPTFGHANIVPVLATSDEQAHDLYIVMPYVVGGNLRQQIREISKKIQQGEKEEKQKAKLQVIHYVEDIAKALNHVHDRGYIHLDVKPENILLDDDPNSATHDTKALLTDFGLARSLQQPSNDPQVEGGTPDYMAPEQQSAKRGKPDERSDIYSLGVVLFEMYTGKTPTAAGTTQTSDQNPQLAKIIGRCLKRKPSERYSDTHKLLQDLFELKASLFAKTRTAEVIIAEPVLPIDEDDLQTEEIVNTYAEPASLAKESLLQELPAVELPEDDKDYIIIHSPDGKSSYEILREDVGELSFSKTIGSAPGSDIQLNDLDVDAEHVRIFYQSAATYSVQQLSTNGKTQLGNIRMARADDKNRIIQWQPGEILQVGKTQLELRLAAQQPTEARIIPKLEPDNLPLKPGETASATIIVQYKGTVSDTITIEVRGTPKEWLQENEIQLTLQPSRTMTPYEVPLTFSLAHSAALHAGQHNYTVRITSTNQGMEVNNLRGTIQVAPFYDFSVSLMPSYLHNDSFNPSFFQLIVHNRGNKFSTFRVSSHEGNTNLELDIHLNEEQLKLEPAQSSSVTIEAIPKLQTLVHGANRFHFQILVDLISGGASYQKRVFGDLIVVRELVNTTATPGLSYQQSTASVAAPIPSDSLGDATERLLTRRRVFPLSNLSREFWQQAWMGYQLIFTTLLYISVILSSMIFSLNVFMLTTGGQRVVTLLAIVFGVITAFLFLGIYTAAYINVRKHSQWARYVLIGAGGILLPLGIAAAVWFNTRTGTGISTGQSQGGSALRIALSPVLSLIIEVMGVDGNTVQNQGLGAFLRAVGSILLSLILITIGPLNSLGWWYFTRQSNEPPSSDQENLT